MTSLLLVGCWRGRGRVTTALDSSLDPCFVGGEVLQHLAQRPSTERDLALGLRRHLGVPALRARRSGSGEGRPQRSDARGRTPDARLIEAIGLEDRVPSKIQRAAGWHDLALYGRQRGAMCEGGQRVTQKTPRRTPACSRRTYRAPTYKRHWGAAWASGERENALRVPRLVLQGVARRCVSQWSQAARATTPPPRAYVVGSKQVVQTLMASLRQEPGANNDTREPSTAVRVPTRASCRGQPGAARTT